MFRAIKGQRIIPDTFIVSRHEELIINLSLPLFQYYVTVRHVQTMLVLNNHHPEMMRNGIFPNNCIFCAKLIRQWLHLYYKQMIS